MQYQPDPTVGLRITTITVNLDSCTFYIKIRIGPCLDRIIPSLFKMIRPRITNKLNGQFLSLVLKPLVFFSCQQLWMKVAAVLFCISSLEPFFSSLSEACWALSAAVNTSSSDKFKPR
jgi:hypothetical protein